MKKNILGLIVIFSINSLDVNAKTIEVKKQKASMLVDKTSLNISNVSLPKIIEDSVVVKKASKDFIKLKSLEVSGEYAYSLRELNLSPNTKNKSTIPLSLNEIQAESSRKSNADSNYLLKNDLRVVLVGPYKKVLISNGAFIIRFNKNVDKNKFLQDYDIEKRTDFPDFTSYKAKTFYKINELLDDIFQDERVDTVELDLIDPTIRPN